MKNCVLIITGRTLFGGGAVSKNGKGTLTEDKLKLFKEIKEYVIKNDWVQGMVEAFFEILPAAIKQAEPCRKFGLDTTFHLLSKLIAQAVKSTLNLWEVFFQVCRGISESERNSYLVDFRQKRVADYVKFGRILMLLEPIKAVLGNAELD